MSFVRTHIKALDTHAAGRRASIQQNIDQILADSHDMLMTQGSWCRYQVLRAGHIGRDEANAVENERFLARLVAVTQREHTQAMDDVAHLLDDLERQCHLFVELPDEFSLPFTNKCQHVRDVVAMAEALAERVAAVRNRAHTQPTRLEPPLIGVQ